MRSNRFNWNSESELMLQRCAFLNTEKLKNGPMTNIHESVRKTQRRLCDMSVPRLKVVAHEEGGAV